MEPEVEADDEETMEVTVVYCLVILKKTGAQMKESYTSYLSMKKSKKEAPLAFRDYVFLHTISQVDLFVFEHTKLAFDMMCVPVRVVTDVISSSSSSSHCVSSSSSSPAFVSSSISSSAAAAALPKSLEVELKRFAMYAPNLGIATPLYATDLFLCLQNREEKLEYEQFRIFIDCMKKVRKEVTDHLPILAQIPDVQDDETIVVYRGFMLDTSHRPPRMGSLLLCRYHIIFETSLFKTRHIFPYTSLRMDEHSVRLYSSEKQVVTTTNTSVNHALKQELPSNPGGCVLELEPIGYGDTLEKDKEFFICYLKDMMTIHSLVKKMSSSSSSTDLKNAMMDDTCRRVQCNWILYELGFARPRVSPFFHARQDSAYKKNISMYSKSIKLLGADSDRELTLMYQDKCASLYGKKRRRSFWHPIGSKLSSNHKEDEEEIDPEHVTSSPMPAFSSLRNPDLPPGTETSTTIAQKAQEFDYKLFAHNVSLLVDYMQPAFLVVDGLQRLKNWDHPTLSLSVFLLLLSAAYNNLHVHLPAVLLGLNLVLLGVCRYYPEEVRKALGVAHEEESMREAEYEHVYQNANPFTRFNLWKQRVKANVSKVMSGLESMHEFIAFLNDRLVRFGGLYQWTTWRASAYYSAAMFLLSVLYYFLPFNVLFALGVIDFFTEKFQPTNPEGNAINRLLAMVQVTDRTDPTASVIPYCSSCNACVMHPAFSIDEANHKEQQAGWLDKRRGFLGKWHSRWCVLGGSHLVYYQHMGDVGQTAPKGVVHLSHAMVTDAGPGEKGGSIFYIQEPGRAKMTLQAATEAQKLDWIAALAKAPLKTPVQHTTAFEVLPDDDSSHSSHSGSR